MAPTQIFQHYLQIIAAESGISEDRILSKSKETDVVDVRSILIHTLHIYSLYPAHIANLVGVSVRRVWGTLSEFDDRLKQSRFMQAVWRDVKDRCPELRG